MSTVKEPVARLQCDIRTNFAKAFCRWRKENNLMLKEVAAEMGVALGTVNAWERGEKFPTPQHFQALVNYTQMPPCRFFCVMADQCVPAECLLAMLPPAALPPSS
jgi:transcriptional regulator with XRE-family HTH domain